MDTRIVRLNPHSIIIGQPDLNSDQGKKSKLQQCEWAYSSVVEHLTADQEVTGSNPVGPFQCYFYLLLMLVFSTLLYTKHVCLSVKKLQHQKVTQSGDPIYIKFRCQFYVLLMFVFSIASDGVDLGSIPV